MTVAKLNFISNYVLLTDTEKTIFANLKTFYYGAVAKLTLLALFILFVFRRKQRKSYLLI